MRNSTRRDFLKQLTAASLVAIVGRNSLAAFGPVEGPFEMLVIGDSLIWGQGLEEKDKFYALTADWIRNGAFGQPRQVNLTVKAHSGATIRFDSNEAAKYRAAGRDENYFYKGEVNVSMPSIWKQVETAADEYKRQGREHGSDLVMLSAGITDISVEGVLNPFEDPQKLRPVIEEVCQRRVCELLEHISKFNPDARIVLIGYYSMISPRSSRSAVFNAWLEILNFPNWLQGFVNNPVMRPLVFGKLFKRAMIRSKIWKGESDRQLLKAVDQHNAKVGRTQAIFISPNFNDENAFDAPNTLLFRMHKNGSVEDPQFSTRKSDCRTAFEDLEIKTGIKYALKRCTVAAVGHPNPAGSRSYFESIKAKLSSALNDPIK
ncbi:MAG: SGNH/GDSL hydrolase family protein [Pyrinomonadaceae bacterium]|nr:SGNH/GDSL hydrolase family protein [Acidobacteriota bacterium]MBK7932899.1 SGNH/GDSL hydrolase family protein [Acidobacteriota bacterium]MBP7376346.1 SGNH/GDSL hydrolase family protein [Pyrinomonadaceae bacterium]